jgi:hypothetical protein
MTHKKQQKNSSTYNLKEFPKNVVLGFSEIPNLKKAYSKVLYQTKMSNESSCSLFVGNKNFHIKQTLCK